VEFVGIFDPAVADVGAVVHVGDHDVFDARVHLGFGLQHGLPRADDDQNDSARAGDEPLAFDFLYIFDVNAVEVRFLEDDGAVFGKLRERRLIIEGKWRDDDANADLKPAACAPFRFRASG
jgi:hypothetical protein